jgi:hypothetical protein
VRPGPVRFLQFLSENEIVIVGKLTRLSDIDNSYGFEYINLVDLRDGSIVSWLTSVVPVRPIPDINVMFVEVLNPKEVIIVDPNAGLLLWEADTPNAVEWRYKAELPLYITLGGNNRALLVEADGINVSLISTDNGAIIKSAGLPSRAIGKPLATADRFYLPIEGGLLLINGNLLLEDRLPVPGLSGKAQIFQTEGGIIIVGIDGIMGLIL